LHDDETNDDETNDDETNDDETNDDETNDDETNDDGGASYHDGDPRRSLPIGLPTGRHDAMERLSASRYLRERVGDDSAMDVGQPILAALVAERQPLVIDATQMKNRGLHIVHMHR